MTDPEFDEDGYPTEGTLQTIRDWPTNKFSDHEDLMEFCHRAWNFSEYFVRAARRHRPHKGLALRRRWEVHTVGWSGNESIIAALRENQMFWMICWVQSRVGGHYIFETRSE